MDVGSTANPRLAVQIACKNDQRYRCCRDVRVSGWSVLGAHVQEDSLRSGPALRSFREQSRGFIDILVASARKVDDEVLFTREG